MADALARRSQGLTLDPAKLTVDQYRTAGWPTSTAASGPGP